MKNGSPILAFLGILTSLFLWSCFPKPNIPTPHSGEADLSHVVVVGGTWLSGYRDGALWANGQESSVGNLLAKQFAMAESGLVFSQPLLEDAQGVGLSFKAPKYQTRGLLGDKMDCEGNVSLSVLRTSLTTSEAGPLLAPVATGLPDNMAIPYATTLDLLTPDFGLNPDPGGANPYYYRFASSPGSSTVTSDAESLDASFFVYWPGFEDIYNYAIWGGTRNLIASVGVFEANADSILAQLTSNGAKGILANIPDFENMPFFTTVPPLGVNLTTQGQVDTLNDRFAGVDSIQWHLGDNGFFIEDTTMDTPPGTQFRQLLEEEFVLLNLPLDSVKCMRVGVGTIPLPHRYYLDIYQIETLRTAIAAYNNTIVNLSIKYNLPIANINLLLNNVQKGLRIEGADFNTDFASGNFYSVDGQNPTPKGSVIVANEFIRTINDFYAAGIPPLSIHEYSGVLFP